MSSSSRNETDALSARLLAHGHMNISGRHTRTFEIVRDQSVSESGTCIIGVDATYDPDILLKMRGEVRISLECGSATETIRASINPFYIDIDPIIVRTHPQPQHRSFCIDANKGAAALSPKLIEQLQQPGAELEMTVVQTGPPGRGALFVVGVPIGNKLDLSPRAISTLRSVDIILAEDTRSAKQDLGSVRGQIISYHSHNERHRTADALEALSQGKRVALISEAGMPLISDPGYTLLREAAQAGMLITCVPGPDAVTTALSISGLPASDFRFLGFLPSKAGQLSRTLDTVSNADYTLVMFEAAHRLKKTLSAISDQFGDRQIALCRNLTRPGEEVFRGTANQVAEQIASRVAERGQFVIVIEPCEQEQQSIDLSGEMRLLAGQLLEDGVSTKTVARAVTKAVGGKRRDAFQSILALKAEIGLE